MLFANSGVFLTVVCFRDRFTSRLERLPRNALLAEEVLELGCRRTVHGVRELTGRVVDLSDGEVPDATDLRANGALATAATRTIDFDDFAVCPVGVNTSDVDTSLR